MRGKLVYWPLNRLNEEESGRGQGAGKGADMEGWGGSGCYLHFLNTKNEG